MSKPDHVPAVIRAARRWAAAHERALDPKLPEGLVGVALADLSNAEAKLRRAVRRLERAEKQMSETANNP